MLFNKPLNDNKPRTTRKSFLGFLSFVGMLLTVAGFFFSFMFGSIEDGWFDYFVMIGFVTLVLAILSVLSIEDKPNIVLVIISLVVLVSLGIFTILLVNSVFF